MTFFGFLLQPAKKAFRYIFFHILFYSCGHSFCVKDKNISSSPHGQFAFQLLNLKKISKEKWNFISARMSFYWCEHLQTESTQNSPRNDKGGSWNCTSTIKMDNIRILLYSIFICNLLSVCIECFEAIAYLNNDYFLSFLLLLFVRLLLSIAI